MKFDYSESDPLNGILYWLYKTKGESYYKNVVVSVSSWNKDAQKPKNAIDFVSSTYWISSGKREEEYLDIYLPYHKVKLSGFVIQTSNIASTTGYHPKIWSFAISNNNKDFDNIQTFEDINNELKGPSKTKFSSYESNFVQSFRLYALNNSYNTFHGFDLAQIEFFWSSETTLSFMSKENSI